MDMPIVDVEGHEAQQLANYDMPAVFSDDDGSAQKKRGRVLDSCWEYLTDQAYPNILIQSKCRSCNIMVKHHKKSEKVKSHLNHCAPFKATMKDVSANDLPAWFTTQGQGQSKSLANGSSSLQANQGDIRSFTIAKMTQKNHQDVHYLLAMHFYMTGASFVWIEEQQLLEAMQKLHPDATVPLQKELAGKYLIKCYNNVKIKVDAWLAQGS